MNFLSLLRGTFSTEVSPLAPVGGALLTTSGLTLPRCEQMFALTLKILNMPQFIF